MTEAVEAYTQIVKETPMINTDEEEKVDRGHALDHGVRTVHSHLHRRRHHHLHHPNLDRNHPRILDQNITEVAQNPIETKT